MHFNRYYNRQISIDELDYITEENIQTSNINITSDKMYSEVHDYNDHMFEMQKKREIYVRDFWKVLIFNIIGYLLIFGFTFTFGSFDFIVSEKFSLFYKISKSIPFCLGTINIIYLAFFFLVFIKKKYEKKFSIGIMLLMIPVNICVVALIAFNIYFFKTLKEHHDAIKEDAGYPYFLPINMTFYNEEVMEKAKKSVKEYKFDDYKIDPDAEMGIPSLD